MDGHAEIEPAAAVTEDGEGLPALVSVALERDDALAVTLARVARGEIVVLEARGDEVAAVVPRELALLLAEIAADREGEPGCGGAPRDAPWRTLERAAAPVEVLFTDLDAGEEDWIA